MIIGHRYWILIWYGILAIGVLGFLTAAYWGRRTSWKNVDEILRAVGTMAVSIGMLVLLNRGGGGFGEAFLVLALFCFVLAFVLGRRGADNPPGSGPHSEAPEDE
ncbi:MAG: hypothetical protein FJ206_12385 [Gemmatimonadetes bacterium]|nr:hypothetical protein [Gemmatimonadota bacterium]